MLDIVLADNNKVLIFSQFVKHLNIVKKEIEKRKIPYCYIDGSTQKRMQEVEKFQKMKEFKVFLISLKAGGVGLNLTAADYVFMLDPWWNPAAEAQAIDRAHRIGQDKNVFVCKFITQDSVEEKILKIQERKRQLSADLITAEAAFSKSLSREDIAEIFS
jgi:SNF2 family DNA or RNA helicase